MLHLIAALLNGAHCLIVFQITFGRKFFLFNLQVSFEIVLLYVYFIWIIIWSLPIRVKHSLSLNKSKKKLHILCINFEKKNRCSRRCFDVYATSITLKRRRMDVQTTSCAYWGSFQSLNINQWCILIVKSKNSIFFSKFQFRLILNWFVKITGFMVLLLSKKSN